MLSPEYREVLLSHSEGSRLVLTTLPRGPKAGCLVVYPLPLWREIEDNLMKMENPLQIHEEYREVVVSGAEEMVPDSQGRIRITERQLDFAGITDEAVLAGNLDCFRIWQPQRFEAILQQNFSNIAAGLPPGTGRIF